MACTSQHRTWLSQEVAIRWFATGLNLMLEMPSVGGELISRSLLGFAEPGFCEVVAPSDEPNADIECYDAIKTDIKVTSTVIGFLAFPSCMRSEFTEIEMYQNDVIAKPKPIKSACRPKHASLTRTGATMTALQSSMQMRPSMGRLWGPQVGAFTPHSRNIRPQGSDKAQPRITQVIRL